MSNLINLSLISFKNANFNNYKNSIKKQNTNNQNSSNLVKFASSNLDVLGRASLLIGKNSISFSGNKGLSKDKKESFEEELKSFTYTPYLATEEIKRFLETDVRILSNLVNEDNIEQVRELLGMNIASGLPKFSLCQMVSLINSMSDKNFPFIRRLANENNSHGVPRFEDYLISSIAQTINEKNTPFIYPLLDLKTSGGESRLSGFDAKDLFSIVNQDNYGYVCELLRLEDSIGRPRFSGGDVNRIVSATTSQNKEYVDRLLAFKNQAGKPLFNATSIELIAKNANEDNFKFVDKILAIKNEYFNSIYENDSNSVAHLFVVANDENFNRIEQLVKANQTLGRKFSGFGISLLAKKSTEENFDRMMKLFSQKDSAGNFIYSGIDISHIIETTGEN